MLIPGQKVLSELLRAKVFVSDTDAARLASDTERSICPTLARIKLAVIIEACASSPRYSYFVGRNSVIGTLECFDHWISQVVPLQVRHLHEASYGQIRWLVLKRHIVDARGDVLERERRNIKIKLAESYAVFQEAARIQHVGMPHHQNICAR